MSRDVNASFDDVENDIFEFGASRAGSDDSPDIDEIMEAMDKLHGDH